MLKEGVFLGKRYEILGRIGSGGMADVYKGKDHKLNRYVAVKVLKSDYRNDESFIKKFVSEAQAAAGLMHPNVVNVYDVGQDRGLYYMVMELVEGITLKEYIEKKERLSAKETISISIQMISGIQAAHNHHIIHRDIKPQNIIISKDGKVKVTDFGIARATTSTATISTNVMGSVHYTSPEQAKGGIVDERSDIYSAGISMYEMVTGHVPFDGDSTVSVALKHLKEKIVAPSVEVPDIPYSLDCIIMKCTEKNVERRYQNCQDLISDLKHSLVDPDGHFVDEQLDVYTGRKTTGDETILMSEDEIRRAQERSYSQSDDYDDPDYDDYDYDDDDYDDDDYDDDDDDYRAPTQRRNSDYNRKKNVDPNTKKIMKILMVVAAAIIAMVIIFMVGNAMGAFKGGIGLNTTTNDAKVVVPNLLGMTEDEAKAALKKKNLGYSIAGREESDKYAAGEIMEQSEKANSKVEKNTEIKVVISTGKAKKTVSVPDVKGMSEDDAQKTLENLNLVVEAQAQNSDTVASGKVISTDPAEGTQLTEGSKVTMYVSLGIESVEVPSIIGMSSEEAQSAIQNVGLQASVTEDYSDTVTSGMVISQDPASGKVKKGSTVNIVVSKGTKVKMVTVPSLSGMTQQAAEQAIIDAGLTVGSVTEEYNAGVSAGYVISQTASVGSQIEKGSSVGFVVSKGAQPSTDNGNTGGEDNESSESQ